MSSLKKLISIAAVSGAFLASSAAYAISYDASSMGTTAPAGATFTSVGGSLGLKTQAGFTFLGVRGGAAGNEIDAGQSLTITFDAPTRVTELVIGLLFDGPEYNDPQERALMTITPSNSTYSLQAIGSTDALWDGLGVVSNLSPAIVNLGAVWKIVNPFGATWVKSLTLTPDASIVGSDFGLVRVATNVPDTASTLGLMGAALLGLAFFRRSARN